MMPLIFLGPSLIATALLAQAPAILDRAAQDREVIALILDDLVTGKGSPVAGTFVPGPPTLNPKPLRYSIKKAELTEQAESKAWGALPKADRSHRAAALQDMADRMTGPVVRFTTGSSQVRLYKGRDPDKLSEFDARPINATLPGYSKDGRIAIVAVSAPWSIHSCGGFYVLSRSSEGWRVDLRDVQCSL